MPLRRAANLAATIRVAMKIAAATSAAAKIEAANRAASNHVAPHNAASTIARRNLPVPPHPALSRKSPFFSPANLLPNIVASPSPLLCRPSSSRKIWSHNLKSKKRFRAHPLG